MSRASWDSGLEIIISSSWSRRLPTLWAHEIEYADLYIDTLAATDFWRTSSTPSVLFYAKWTASYTLWYIWPSTKNTYIIDIVTKLCGHTTVGEKMFHEVGGNCGYFLRALMSTFPDNYLQWTYDTILDGSQRWTNNIRSRQRWTSLRWPYKMSCHLMSL
jgi:hypothetical protein